MLNSFQFSNIERILSFLGLRRIDRIFGTMPETMPDFSASGALHRFENRFLLRVHVALEKSLWPARYAKVYGSIVVAQLVKQVCLKV